MMKANEFRLGNLVKCPQGDGQVTQIQDREVLVVDEIGYTMEVIKPIPLTEEWLLKFGFEHYLTDKSEVYRLHGFMATYVTKGKFIGKRFFKFNDTTWKDFGHIQNVHQLQNIYYAIIGKELKLD